MTIMLDIATATVVMSLLMAVLWYYQVRRQEADIVDAGWAAGLGVLAIFYALTADGNPIRRVVLAVLAGTWASRLAYYLTMNRVLKQGEDGRYQELRNRWGASAQLYFFWFFQAQGILVIILSIPFFIVALNREPGITGWGFVGLCVFVVSIFGETIADAQLDAFKKDPNNKGKACDVGLWRYSRHPNYFFEWVHWWSYVFLAIGSPYWYFTLIGPILMLYLMLKVTGIPPCEKRALATRGEEYRRYQVKTSAFVPWFPKKPSDERER